MGIQSIAGALLLFCSSAVYAQTCGNRRKLAAEPKNESSLPLDEIEGAFSMDVAAVFHELDSNWQPLVDFGDGPCSENIILAQCENTTDLCFDIWKDCSRYSLRAADAIEVGQDAMWSFGTSPAGVMFLKKDGVTLAERDGPAPTSKGREKKLLGRSSWNTSPFNGAIKGVAITNHGQKTEDKWMNKPQNIYGAFNVTAYARFDDLSSDRRWQRVSTIVSSV